MWWPWYIPLRHPFGIHCLLIRSSRPTLQGSCSDFIYQAKRHAGPLQQAHTKQCPSSARPHILTAVGTQACMNSPGRLRYSDIVRRPPPGPSAQVRARFPIRVAPPPPSPEPWQSIPFEIMSIIFSSCLDEPKTASRVPTTISLICRTWRNIALNTLHLWTHIHIVGDVGIRTAFLWLQRSKSAPLAIHYVLGNQRPALVAMVLETICNHIGRTAHLSIEIYAQVQHAFVVKQLKVPAPNLRTLRIRQEQRSDSYWVVESDLFHSIFGGHMPPLLESLDLVLPYSRLPVELFHSLRDVDLNHSSYTRAEDIFELVRSIPRLTSLKFRILPFFQDWISFSRGIAILPTLEHLEVTGQIWYVRAALDHFDLPKLRSMRLEFDLPSPHDFRSSHRPEFILPFPSLEQLTLIDTSDQSRPSHVHLPWILQRCGSLVDLCLTHNLAPLYTMLRDCLTPEGKGTWLCPRIRHLEVTADQPCDSLSSIGKFLGQRFFNTRVETVQTVSLRAENVDPLTKKQLAGLRRLRVESIRYNETSIKQIHI